MQLKWGIHDSLFETTFGKYFEKEIGTEAEPVETAVIHQGEFLGPPVPSSSRAWEVYGAQ